MFHCSGNGEMAGYLDKGSGKWSTQGETGKLKPICEKSTGGETTGIAHQYRVTVVIAQLCWVDCIDKM